MAMKQQTATRKATDKGPIQSDTELVAAVRNGDMQAMEQLMRRHNRTLYRTARAILRDDGEAEDAVQEAYLLAYRALDRFRGESRLGTWLVRIAANVALARRRRNARGALVVPINGTGDETDDLGEAMIDRAGPEREAMAAEVRRLLERRIDALPDMYREVFMLRAVEELSVEETAAVLQIPEPTVRTRYFRARSLLRESLAKEVDFALGEVFGFDGERCDRIVSGVLAALGAAEAGASPLAEGLSSQGRPPQM
ncbi:MAG: polymerase sigma factor [Rhodocyclaceae bacterium]|nr:polymerase sigma factor [Rhodocyclaceae bacterium]